MRGNRFNGVFVPTDGLAKDENVPIGKHSGTLRLKALGDLLAGANEMGAMVGMQVGDVRLGELGVSRGVAHIAERVADVAVLRQGDLRMLATDHGT